MAIDWRPLGDIFRRNERFVLTSHVRPDADAIGSELGLAALLEGLGKRVRIINPTGMPEHIEFLDPNRRVMKFGQESDGVAVNRPTHTFVPSRPIGTVAEAEVLRKMRSRTFFS